MVQRNLTLNEASDDDFDTLLDELGKKSDEGKKLFTSEEINKVKNIRGNTKEKKEALLRILASKSSAKLQIFLEELQKTKVFRQKKGRPLPADYLIITAN